MWWAIHTMATKFWEFIKVREFVKEAHCWFLGAFAKLRQAAINLIMSVSVELGSH
jgi:hypothetical protein